MHERSGLKETQTHRAHRRRIRRIPNIVYVAAIGHLFDRTASAALYKTTDGGEDVDEHEVHRSTTPGFTDVVHGSVQPEHRSYAASLPAAAPAAGASTAAGPAAASGRRPTPAKTWTKLTGSGLPDNPIIGRIGLDVARSKPSHDLRLDRSRPERRHRRRRQRRRHARRSDRGAARRRRRRRRAAVAAARRRPIRTKVGIWRSDDARQDVEVPVELRWIGRCTTARSASIRPTSEIAYQGGAPFFKTDRRRQDVAPGAGARAQRSSRDLDRSEEQQPPDGRQRRRPRRQLRPGRDVGVHATRSAPSASSTRSAPTCGSRITSAAGCRTTASWCGPSARAQHQRHPELRLVPRRRRRRLLHGQRSD